MGVIATALAELMDAGISGEQLIRAIAIFEDLLDRVGPRDEARPLRTLSPSAIRMRRYRARKAGVTLPVTCDADSSPVTSHVTPGDGRDASNIRTLSQNSLLEGKNSLPERESEQDSLFDGDDDASHVTPSAKVRQLVAYPADFETFWTAYPTDEGMSKKKAFGYWRSLSAGDRKKAVAAVPHFRVWASKQFDGYRMLHAATFLFQRRFEGFAEKAARVARARGTAGPQEFVRQGTEAWAAWQDWHVARTGRGSPVNQQGGWYFPSAWPPRDDQKMEAGG